MNHDSSQSNSISDIIGGLVVMTEFHVVVRILKGKCAKKMNVSFGRLIHQWQNRSLTGITPVVELSRTTTILPRRTD